MTTKPDPPGPFLIPSLNQAGDTVLSLQATRATLRRRGGATIEVLYPSYELERRILLYERSMFVKDESSGEFVEAFAARAFQVEEIAAQWAEVKRIQGTEEP